VHPNETQSQNQKQNKHKKKERAPEKKRETGEQTAPKGRSTLQPWVDRLCAVARRRLLERARGGCDVVRAWQESRPPDLRHDSRCPKKEHRNKKSNGRG
jgi:hypothetical protein